jgi:hypothetical protein
MVNKAIQAGKAAGRQAKALVKHQVGKVFTDARKLKNNLTQHELVKKLKKDMNRMLLSAKPFIKEVVKGAATAGVHGMGIKQLAKLSPSVDAFVKGYEEGVWQAVVSTKDSVVGLVTDPVGTAKGVVTGVWDTVSNPKESFHNLRRDLEGLYYQVKDGSWETRGQLAGNFVMSTISDKGIGKVLKVTPKSQGTPKRRHRSLRRHRNLRRRQNLRKRNNLLRGRVKLCLRMVGRQLKHSSQIQRFSAANQPKKLQRC